MDTGDLYVLLDVKYTSIEDIFRRQKKCWIYKTNKQTEIAAKALKVPK